MSRRPRLTVFGTGYLGTAHAACLASLGFEVLGVDVDAARASALQAGTLPFYEPGLEPLLRDGLRRGRLSFTTSYPAAAEFGDVHFICVGTPQRPGSGGADLSQFESCFTGLAPLLRRPCLVVGKSTVPPGTAAAYGQRLPVTAPAGAGAELAWNPEFLREGHAVADTLRPDRIVAGVWSGRAEATLREVYAEPLAAGVPFLVTDPATAEMVKVAANAFLATKISFINAMAEVCEVTGADVLSLADALGRDPRIGAAGLRPGLGFGGGCLPKDIRALAARAAELGAGEALRFLHEIDAINQRRRTRLVDMATRGRGRPAGRAAGWACSAWRSSRGPTTSGTRPRWRSRRGSGPSAPGWPCSTRRPWTGPGRCTRNWTMRAPCSARPATPTSLLLLTEWPEFSAADPGGAGQDGRPAGHRGCAGTPWTRTPGAAAAGTTAPGRPTQRGQWPAGSCSPVTLAASRVSRAARPSRSVSVRPSRSLPSKAVAAAASRRKAASPSGVSATTWIRRLAGSRVRVTSP